MRKITFAAASAVALGCFACSSADPTAAAAESTSQALEATDAPEHVHYQRGASPHAGSTGGNLIDHGGPVMAVSNTYAIWWGTASAWPSDARAGLDALFEGLNGSSFLSIASQYMRGSAATTAFHTNWSDSSAPPSRSPRTSAIVNEACSAITANGATPDSSAVYFVFTSNFPRNVNYCAWHSHGTCNGVDIKVAYMPNTTGISGCDPLGVANLGCNSYSQGTVSIANVTSHEYMETITDSDLSAWYDSSGSEIGDKCAWQFSSCVKLGTGSWELQEEWSNSTSGCVQQ